MYRLLIVLILLCLGLPRVVSSSDYKFQEFAEYTLEMANGEINLTKRPTRFLKIYYFVKQYHAVKDPLKLTKLLMDCPYPEVMAAMGAVESGFDSTAVGDFGEVSCWQILEWHKEFGDPTDYKDGLNAAVAHLKEKKIGRTLNGAIRAYNGSGKQAEHYLHSVLRKVERIKSMEVI